MTFYQVIMTYSKTKWHIEKLFYPGYNLDEIHHSTNKVIIFLIINSVKNKPHYSKKHK